MKIAVDFDGTIVDHRFPEIGDAKPFAFDALKALKAEGHQLILWSNREGKHLQEAIDFCKKNGVEFYSVNSDYPDASWSGSGVSRKLMADVYIDDKNLGGIPDWSEIYSILSNNGDKSLHANSSRRKHKKRHHRKKNKFLDFFRKLSAKCKDARMNYRL